MGNWLSRGGAALVVFAQAATALAILQFGDPGPVPMHFGWDGQADRFGDRSEAAQLAAGMALLSLVGTGGLRALSRRKGDEDARNLEIGGAILLAVTSLVVALMAGLAFGLLGPGETIGAGITALISAVLAVVGAYLGKVGPNPLVGVRTPWTFASRLAWDKSNRLAGRLFFWAGLIGMVAAPLAPQPAGMRVMIGVMVAIAAVVVFESWRVWRTDPDRRSAL